jgi:hypothetical protein
MTGECQQNIGRISVDCIAVTTILRNVRQIR